MQIYCHFRVGGVEVGINLVLRDNRVSRAGTWGRHEQTPRQADSCWGRSTGVPPNQRSSGDPNVREEYQCAHVAARHHDAVMVPKTAIMVRICVRKVTRGIEMFCASAGVKLVRVFPVAGVDPITGQQRACEANREMASAAVLVIPEMCAISMSIMPMYAIPRT